MRNNWSINSWQDFKITQQPNYSNNNHLNDILDDLTPKKGLCSFEQVATLATILDNFDQSDFIIQIGDCAEPILNDPKDYVSGLNKLYTSVEKILNNFNLIKIPRLAGQFAKPRTNEFIELEGKMIPSYRGDLINNYNFDELLRNPNPDNLIRGYEHIERVRSNKFNWFYAHEALHLKFEQSLIRTKYNKNYASSSEFVWIGNRSRFLGSAHVEFIRGLINPVGIKIDENISANEIDRLIEQINPANNLGRISFICRFGVENIIKIREIAQYCKSKSYNILWIIDPMHGNTKINKNNNKYRLMNDISQEIEIFCQILKSLNIQIAGIHLEATNENIYECTTNVDDEQNYTSLCDPRLNCEQTLQIIEQIKSLI